MIEITSSREEKEKEREKEREKEKTEPSPRKTKMNGDSTPSPGKQRVPRQKQSVKVKLENLMQKEPELTRRRPVRQASRKNIYSNSQLLLVGIELLRSKNTLRIFNARTHFQAFSTLSGLLLSTGCLQNLQAGFLAGNFSKAQ